MTQTRHPFCIVLLALCLVNLGAMVWREAGPTLGVDGFLRPDGMPAGLSVSPWLMLPLLFLV